MRIMNAAGQAALGSRAVVNFVDNPGGERPPGAQLLLIEHVEDGELDVMEALLRYCYSGKLWADGAPEAGPDVLFQMMMLADRFDMQSCLQLCCQTLARQRKLSIAAINRAFTMPPGISACSAYRCVTDAATSRLLELFGNADAVCGLWYHDPCLRGRSSQDWLLRHHRRLVSAGRDSLLSLCHAALVALLKHPQLEASSEHNVLLMADAWAMSDGGGKETGGGEEITGGAAAAAACGGAAACMSEQLRQLVACLRLGRLSFTFLYDVLPAMTWIAISDQERDSLLHFCVADDVTKASISTCGPQAWYSTPRHPSLRGFHMEKGHGALACSAQLARYLHRMQMCFDEATLAYELQAMGMCPEAVGAAGTPSLCFNGFTVTMSLDYSTTRKQCGIQLSLSVRRGALADRSVPFHGVRIDALLRARTTSGVWGKQSSICTVFHPGGRKVWGLWFDKVDGDPLHESSWHPYMLRGTLDVEECVVTRVDHVGCEERAREIQENANSDDMSGLSDSLDEFSSEEEEDHDSDDD